MKIGEINSLTYSRLTNQGIYLTDENQEEVLLPKKFITPDMEIDQIIDVFVYLDSEDRIVATTQTPKITLNTFKFLKAKEVNAMGAFMDWGLDKDLLVPFKNQKQDFEEDKTYLIYLYLDEQSNRLVGTSKFRGILHSEEPTYHVGDEVSAMVCDKTDLGYSCILDNQFVGLAYHNEVKTQPFRGEIRTAWIKKIREDQKLDISFEPIGSMKIEPNAAKVLDYIKKNDGHINLTDKSSPDDIYDTLQMSKRAFKDALGNLYRKKLVRLEKTKTVLL